MTQASTHTGICQVCGRRQAVHAKTGVIAKHGYTTEYGFFNGTCGGSDRLPLEQDVDYNLAVINAIYNHAASLEAEADAEITAVPVTEYVREGYGRREKKTIYVGADEYATRRDCYGRFEDAVERVRSDLRRAAEMARSHAADLAALREKVHGQPLQPRKVEAPIKREYFKSYREAYARVEELKAQGHKAQQRRQRGAGITVTYR